MSLPDNWGCSSAFRYDPWPAIRDDLLARYGGGPRETRQLEKLFNLATSLDAASVVTESPYVDADYRSEFSHHFSRQFSPPPNLNERLLFRNAEDEIVGMAVMRPTMKPVGRSILEVPHPYCSFVTCTADQRLSVYGSKHIIHGFPFMSQDGDYARCAHAAIWSVARYFHLKFDHAKHLMASIVDASGIRQLPDRTSPSDGLTAEEVKQAFRRLGIPVIAYSPSHFVEGLRFEDVLRMYLDSGIPLVLNTPAHLTTLIGYGVDQRSSTQWIRADDNHSPYERVDDWNPVSTEDQALGKWKAVLVPLPARIHVPAEFAYSLASTRLDDLIAASNGPHHLRDANARGEIEIRMYATESARLKEKIQGSDRPMELARLYLPHPLPVWTWVAEFYLVSEGPQKVLGSMLIDATSSRRSPEALIGDIDGQGIVFSSEGTRFRQLYAAGNRYESFLPDRSVASESNSR